MRRVLAGDVAAFGEIARRHERGLLRLLAGIVGDVHLAEDVLQEVFLVAYQKLPSFEFRSMLRTWLYTITVREALGARARMRRVAQRFRHLDDHHVRAAGRVDRRAELRDEILHHLGKLPERERAALVLNAEGWSYQEVADLLGRPIGTVSAWIHRGRARLTEPQRRSTP